MRRIEASRRNASALRLRFSQSLASLRQRRGRERNGFVELPKLQLAPGMRVRVVSGPLSEQIGMLAALRPHERVLVLLQFVSYMPSQAVQSLSGISGLRNCARPCKGSFPATLATALRSAATTASGCGLRLRSTAV